MIFWNVDSLVWIFCFSHRFFFVFRWSRMFWGRVLCQPVALASGFPVLSVHQAADPAAWGPLHMRSSKNLLVYYLNISQLSIGILDSPFHFCCYSYRVVKALLCKSRFLHSWKKLWHPKLLLYYLVQAIKYHSLLWIFKLQNFPDECL